MIDRGTLSFFVFNAINALRKREEGEKGKTERDQAMPKFLHITALWCILWSTSSAAKEGSPRKRCLALFRTTLKQPGGN